MTFATKVTVLCGIKYARDYFITEWLRAYHIKGDIAYWAKKLQELNDAQRELTSISAV